jgi:hypothetical protein
VSGFILDVMHTCDGGVVPTMLRNFFSFNKCNEKNADFKVLLLGNTYIRAWQKCTPLEIGRRVREWTFLGKWKMNEGRTFLMYIALPLFKVLSGTSEGISRKYNALKHLVFGMRCIAGNSSNSISSVNMKTLH